MSDIRAVTFDCWGTLISDTDFDAAVVARVRALADACDGRLSTDAARDMLDNAWREHHRQWLDGRQYGSEGIAKFLAKDLELDEATCGILQEAFEDAGRHGTIFAIDGAADTLLMLRDAGLRTALVCDAGFTPGRVVRDFLSDQGLLDLLDFCAFSNEVGEPKPNPGIFLAALEAIDCKPAEGIHVGDLLRTDVDGGRRLGMKTIRITTVNDDYRRPLSWNPDATFGFDQAETDEVPPFADADEVIASYAEMPDALRRLGARV